MTTENEPNNHLAGLGRTALATLAVLIFWSAVGYGFWPEFAPRLLGLLRVAQPLRSIGAEEVESQYFDVRNNSDASERQVRRMVEQLEQHYLLLTAFLKREPDRRISVLLTNGSVPAYADGNTLYVAHNRGVIEMDTAAFFLAEIIAGPSSGSQCVDLGLALYACEETGLTGGITGQAPDAWVVLLQENEALMPLEEAWLAEIPDDAEGLFDLFRAIVEGGSFVRWVVETRGWDAAWALRDDGDVQAALGIPLQQAEEEWLAAVASKDLQPKSCLLALPGGQVFRDVCQQLDKEE
jgi:hypothetical protein